MKLTAPLWAVSRTYFSFSTPLLQRRPLRPSFFLPRLSHSPRFPRRFQSHSTRPPRGSAEGDAEPSTLSVRLKKLSREYGYAALAVYLGLSALDFPFCFLAVRYLGTERIGQLEQNVITGFKRVVAELERILGIELHRGRVLEKNGDDEDYRGALGQVDDAQREAGKEGASLWTELVLAYAIHKSFIFIRVPLAAAVTPKVVKVLRGWGYDIGKKGTVREGVKELKKRVD
ncbi:hypothetical protein EV426DRAFT_538402 [Tirmania nivea]|nr:hypothetical protein EV426DRAFT_538402 [Tirmania nivea]